MSAGQDPQPGPSQAKVEPIEEEETVGSDEDEASMDGQLRQVSGVLNKNKIKLWESPYFENGESNFVNLVELSENLGVSLEMDSNNILETLKLLQQRSLDRLKAKKDFTEGGTFRIKLKLARNLLSSEDRAKAPKTSEVAKDATANDLAKKVAEELAKLEAESGSDCCKITPAGLRFISNGKVLEGGKSLTEQGVRPGAPIMVVKIDPDDAAIKVVDEQRKYLAGVKSDAALLGDEDDGGAHGLNVADQSGKTIELPPEEKRSLIIAMSLHEKGRAALKRREFDIALVLLLEADEQFGKVRSELLDRVDNYGLLNLDIVWCYVKLSSVSQLDDAVGRLEKCAGIFRKVYGEDLERLEAIKGSAGQERALYLRMHILQAVAHHHSGDPAAAKRSLANAKKLFKQLDVKQEDLDEVKANGYSEKEARLALRATGGKSVAEAVVYAEQKRKDRKRIEEEEEERSRKRRKYGKTADGSYVNIGFVKSLMSMGYSEEVSFLALRQSNNDLNAAIDVITNNPDVVDAMVVSYVQDQQVEKAAKEVEKAAKAAGIDTDAVAEAAGLGAGAKPNKADHKRKKEAEDRLVDDLGDSLGDTDAHLDLTLEEEKELIDKYARILEGKKAA